MRDRYLHWYDEGEGSEKMKCDIAQSNLKHPVSNPLCSKCAALTAEIEARDEIIAQAGIAGIPELQSIIKALTAEVEELKAEKGMADMGFVSEGASKKITDLKAALEKIKGCADAEVNSNSTLGFVGLLAKQALETGGQ